MDWSDVANLSDDFSAIELVELAAAAKAAGLVGQVTYIDDPNSPEGREGIEYVNSHHWLPEDYSSLPTEQVKALGQRLFDPNATLLEKKKALMLLGHRGSIEAYRILKQFDAQPPAELEVWSQMAFEECKTFLASQLTEDTKFGLNAISTKIGRNDPCPCGSGKKYKRCCGAGK